MGLLLLQGSAALNPRELFANGEQGLWLDPSDFSTMWQDSGKTTPVTAAGDPVGYISDKSGRGNDASQSTSASRPTLARIPSSGRRNLLTYSEQFDVTTGGWTKVNIAITANGESSPDGTVTADKFTETAVTNQFFVNSGNVGSTAGAGESRVFSCYVKAAERSWIRLSIGGSAFPSSNCWFNVSTGSVGTQTGGTGAIQSVGNGWYRCSITATSSGAGTVLGYCFLSSADNTFSYAGTLGSGAFFWGAQLETGSSPSNYQKVVATTDVTESGVSDLWHLVFDGSDDSLVTNSVDFTGTDEMTVIAGVRKVGSGMVCELSATTDSNNGSFHLYTAGTTNWQGLSKGTSSQTIFPLVGTPATSVVSLSSDISTPNLSAKLDGVAVSPNTGSQGTGNYSNAVLYIGRRGGTTLPFNGHIYQLIIRGRTTPTGKLLEAEKFVSKKAGINL